jgi:hypothetical protein
VAATYLQEHPGGVIINQNTIAYDNGSLLIDVGTSSPNSRASDCPAGWFCFYAGLYFDYPRGRLSGCGWQDLHDWGWNDRISSVAYNMSSGSATFYQHERSPSHTGDTPLFTVGVNHRSIADVGSASLKADHVFRQC